MVAWAQADSGAVHGSIAVSVLCVSMGVGRLTWVGLGVAMGMGWVWIGSWAVRYYPAESQRNQGRWDESGG